MDRIIDAFPANQQRQIRMQLSLVLQAVVSQQLVPTVDGGIVPVFEIMTATPAIRNLIREEKTHQIDSVIASSSGAGMRTMDQSLHRLVKEGTISKEVALQHAIHQEASRSASKQKGCKLSNYDWKCGKEYREIRYELCDGVAKISINRPERRNAFTPLTVMEMYDAFSEARDDASVGVILLTGVNHGGRHEDEAFCSGGDQKKRGNGGYVGEDNIPRLNVLDLQRLIAWCPSPSSPW